MSGYLRPVQFLDHLTVIKISLKRKIELLVDITKRTKTVSAFKLHRGAPMLFKKEG